ncbi:tumor necrosis factor receptor superfamily member 6-like [Myxocyprinus asiaticus]|uniref:tumor necrosis factor receptor superfamily member 6-like n=1 Tax=Myxocyprinus asiaticus TaxID=70543 RepID=UPI002221C2BE|nr:tumor necrosis factor receptor superfamily member 6-like [Myxocyprinus asiaticus]
MMLTFLSILLLSSHNLPLIESLNCDNRTQYIHKDQCCQKCKPGQYMKMRCQPGSFDTQCGSCSNGYFTAGFNNDFMKCSECTKCSKEYMKYETNCTLTHDAVCTCHEGYRCSDSTCQTCVKVQTTATTMTNRPPPPTTLPENGMWISVSLCFACVCLCALFTCFLLISRHARPCERIMPTSTCFSSSKKNDSGSSQCTEEEEVPMPVQEVCGKTEKLEEV